MRSKPPYTPEDIDRLQQEIAESRARIAESQARRLAGDEPPEWRTPERESEQKPAVPKPQPPAAAAMIQDTPRAWDRWVNALVQKKLEQLADAVGRVIARSGTDLQAKLRNEIQEADTRNLARIAVLEARLATLEAQADGRAIGRITRSGERDDDHQPSNSA